MDIFEHLHPSIQHDLYSINHHSKPTAFLNTIAYPLFEVNSQFFSEPSYRRVLLYFGELSLGHRHYIYFDTHLKIYIYHMEIGDLSFDLIMYHDWTSFLNSVFQQIQESLSKKKYKEIV